MRSSDGVGVKIEAAELGSMPGTESTAPWLRHEFRNLLGRVLHFSRPRTKTLRLCESLPLGDRRFVAVVEYASSRFLLGGTPTSLVLLAKLPDREAQRPPTFSEQDACAGRGGLAAEEDC